MNYKKEANIITEHVEMIERCRALVRDGNIPSAAILYGEIIAKLNECED